MMTNASLQLSLETNPLNASITAETNSTSHPCGVFFFIIYGPCFGVVCGLGLVGNALSFAVLHRYSRDNVATFLLKSLAVADNLLLLSAGSVQISTGMALYFGYQEQLGPFYPYIITYAWPTVQITQLLSVWMTVLVAANRYVAVCKPLHAPQLCTKGRVQIQITMMVVFVIIYSTPRFFDYRMELMNVTQADNTTRLEEVNVGLATNHVYNILYENIFYCLFVFFLPLVVLVFFNFHLVNVLKKAKRHWSTPGDGDRMVKCVGNSVANVAAHNRQLLRTNRSSAGSSSKARSGEENNITLVMAIIVLTFIVCETPATINQIAYYILLEDQSVCTIYWRFFHICNLLVVINSSMNFIIYCLFRRQFQQQLLDLFCCRKRIMPKHQMRSGTILQPISAFTRSSEGASRCFRRGDSRTRENSFSNVEAFPLRENGERDAYVVHDSASPFAGATDISVYTSTDGNM